jgi:uncharacterized protein with NAD-binding domain and iron-sulfur cluster
VVVTTSRPVEVAVIGGGCASIAAAYELTRPEHGGRYRVTVYQRGLRLGGKGASGRGPADRIEEHGLHIWMGFYENAFRLMRECYAELGRDPATSPLASWRDAFVPGSEVGVTELAGVGPDGEPRWLPWTSSFPPMPGLPGDPLADANPFTVGGYLTRIVQLIALLLDATRPEGAAASAGAPPEGTTMFEWLRGLVRYAQVGAFTGVVEALRGLEAVLSIWGRSASGTGGGRLPGLGLVLELVDALSSSVVRVLEARLTDDVADRRLFEIVDLMLTIVRGSLRFGLMTDPRGFDAIDDYDFRDWLEDNGASRATLDSAFVRAVAYDLIFAYEDGDPARPRTSAAQALRGGMRMLFTYRGALFWRMQAGMGDVVFAPFYELLERRGVRFEFFHHQEAVRLADPGSLAPGERSHVRALEFSVQATVEGGGPYRPLVDVGGLPCWPSEPDWDQLEDGEALRGEGREFESFWDRRRVGTRTLSVGEGFDAVVLGIGLGAVPHVCRDLVETDPRWRRMVANVATVETQAFQLWLRPEMAELGWHGPRHVTLSGFVEPFDTWADMGHLLPREGWPDEGPDRPRSLAYFCNVLPTPPGEPDRDDEGYPARRRREVRDNAVRFLERDVAGLWPAAVDGEGFRWDLLVEPPARASPDGASSGRGSRQGADRLDRQFWTANVDPSDRYVLSLPGTARDRISPLDATYDNLTVAGDWTACGHVAGCVEAAVISGRLAAHAISGLPPLEEIVGYDHP